MDHRPAREQYRGRRRVPTLPRSRLAAVMTTALVGAGVVALAAGAALPQHADPLGLTAAATATDTTERLGEDGRVSRGDARGNAVQLDQAAPDVWLLPMGNYHVTSQFGTRWGKLHGGVDLGAKEGEPFHAVAAGVVTLCRWNGGYGYAVEVDHGAGIKTVYGHSSVLKCRVGQKVQAGDLLALTGNTGHSFGAHLHFEVRINNVPIEPTAYMKKRGVDILAHAQAIYGDQISD